MTMRLMARRTGAALALWAALSACAQNGSAPGDPVRAAASASGAEWVIARATGGIAALEIVRAVERTPGGGARWTAYMRRLCAADAGCPALDSASGVLPREDADRLWAAVAEARMPALAPDYGIGPGADRMATELSVRIGGRTLRTRGDESTLPDGAARLMETVNSVVVKARDATVRTGAPRGESTIRWMPQYGV